MAENTRKLSSLPSGRVYQPPVIDSVNDSGNSGGVVGGDRVGARPFPSGIRSGERTDFLAELSVSTGICDQQLTNPGINSSLACPAGQGSGSGPFGPPPGFPLPSTPGIYPPGLGQASQSVGSRPMCSPGYGYRGAYEHSSGSHPGQPADGSGFRQYPGSYGHGPYMSGFPPAGSGGPALSSGQVGQPQTQAGPFGQFWGHSQSAGPFPYPPGYGFNPMAVPFWNPWGLVSPSRRPVSGAAVFPPQRSAALGASVAGSRKVRRTFRTSASRAVPVVSGSKGSVLAVKPKPAALAVKRSAPKRPLVEPSPQNYLEVAPLAGPFPPPPSCQHGVEDMDCEGAGSAEEDDVVHLSPGCSDIDPSLSDDDPQELPPGEDFQEEDEPEAAEVEAQQVLSGMRGLRADVSRILGEEVCPPPASSSVPESTTLLGSLVAPQAAARAARSLPEGTIVSSALATAQSRVLEKNSSAARAPGFAGLQLGVGDLSEVHAPDYATHDGLLAPQPARLESRELAAWPGKSVDQVVFGPKEHHKVERMLRLSIQVLSYIDFLTVCLYRVSDLPEGQSSETEQADIQDRVTSALNGALRALASLQVSSLVNVLLARRFSVLKNRPVDEPYRSRLLTAPFSGTTLFGGALPSVQKDLKGDSVASALLVKRIQAEKASTSQGSAPPKKKAKTAASQSATQPKSRSSFKGNKWKGKKGKKPPGGKKKSS